MRSTHGSDERGQQCDVPGPDVWRAGRESWRTEAQGRADIERETDVPRARAVRTVWQPQSGGDVWRVSPSFSVVWRRKLDWNVPKQPNVGLEITIEFKIGFCSVTSVALGNFYIVHLMWQKIK